MKIIDKNKDYYDYVSGIYGIDPLVTYDRRGSKILYVDKKLDTSYCMFNINNAIRYDNIVVEIGNRQYFYRVVGDNDYAEYEFHKFVEGNERLSDAPVNFARCSIVGTYFKEKGKFSWDYRYEPEDYTIVKNPILKNTFIPSEIEPEEVWQLISDYISKLKDKDIVDNRTDAEKIESAGFDEKISFRNIK